MPRALVTIGLVVVFHSPALAHASSAAVTTPAASDGVPNGLSNAVGQIARDVVSGLEDTSLVGASDVSLADLQLARGCMGETTECLGPVAEDLGADLLIVPSLDRAAGGFVLTIVAFALSSGSIDRVVRRGDEEALVDGLRAQLHEALRLPPPQDPQDREGTEDTEVVEDTEDVAESPVEETPEVAPATGPGPLPIILTGSGLAAVGVGVIFGVLSQDAQSEYESVMVRSTVDADGARDAYERGASQAVAANVLFAVGGALAVAGVVWWLIAATSAPDAPVGVAPVASPDGVGIIAVGAL